MLIQSACKLCKLTKKAVEYYEQQQLVQPEILENGYRNYTEIEVERLKKVAVLRKLGCSIPEIRKVLGNRSMAALASVSNRRALEIDTMQSKQEIMLRLAQSGDWEGARLSVEALEQKQTILERLLDLFPGSYGRYVSMHFALYLNEPIQSEEQQAAFQTIIAFLDGVHFCIPEDLRAYLEEVYKDFDAGFVAKVLESMDKAIQDPEKYLVDNQEALAQYSAYKQSGEFRNSPAYRLQTLLETFNRESGYNDVFIPAMKRLSSAYRAYHEGLEKADKIFKDKFPQASEPKGGRP